MELIETRQIEGESLRGEAFDLFICSSGFEQRATNALNFVDASKTKRRLAFAFDDRQNTQRLLNDKCFLESKFTLFDACGDRGLEVKKAIQEEIDAIPGRRVRMFVDYSSMTRTWYAAIIDCLRRITSKDVIECYFGYSPSAFENPSVPAPNQCAGPLEGFAGFDISDRPSALVVGLGYERDRAIGLMQYVDPAACFAIIADPPIDPRYTDVVLRNNAQFLDLIGEDHQIRHPLADLQRTGHLLLSLVWGLQDAHRVILAPLGVKPVSLMCLLLALRYPALDVWRVTAGVKGGTPIRRAVGPVLVLRTILSAKR